MHATAHTLSDFLLLYLPYICTYVCACIWCRYGRTQRYCKCASPAIQHKCPREQCDCVQLLSWYIDLILLTHTYIRMANQAGHVYVWYAYVVCSFTLTRLELLMLSQPSSLSSTHCSMSALQTLVNVHSSKYRDNRGRTVIHILAEQVRMYWSSTHHSRLYWAYQCTVGYNVHTLYVHFICVRTYSTYVCKRIHAL